MGRLLWPPHGGLDWGQSTLKHPRAQVLGDRGVVRDLADGALVGAIDGVGHGDRASDAALVAERVLFEGPVEPIVDLFRRCHEALTSTRGVVVSVARIDAPRNQVTWAGVGNVSGVLVRGPDRPGSRHERLSARGGILGYRLPTVRPQTLPFRPGDLLVFATDGIDRNFPEDLSLRGTPARIAREICRRHAKGSDDALVLVVKAINGNALQQEGRES